MGLAKRLLNSSPDEKLECFVGDGEIKTTRTERYERHPLSLCRTWLMGNKRKLRVQAEVSDDRAQPPGMNVGVARRCRDTLMAEERLHVAKIGTPAR
jgi:hypothetical protein